MPSLNKVVLIGRLTRDPELRYTSGGLAVTSFSIAVDRPFKNQQGERVTDFFNCKAWRQKAEFVANYVQKGRLVAVDGRIEMNQVTGQDGSKRTFIDVVCDNVETLDGPRDSGGGQGGEGGGYGGGYGGGGGQRQQAQPADDNGYAPDDAPQARAAAPRQAPRPQQPKQPAPSAYPAEDDFDDSDPFADE